MGILMKIFKKRKCEWCMGDTRNEAYFTSPDTEGSLQIQINSKYIYVNLNEKPAARLDIKYCPMCKRKLKEE